MSTVDLGFITLIDFHCLLHALAYSRFHSHSHLRGNHVETMVPLCSRLQPPASRHDVGPCATNQLTSLPL